MRRTASNTGTHASHRTYRPVILIVVAALVAALLPTAKQLSASAAVAGAGTPDQFVYDEAGRLRAVIDFEGDAAKYRYDKLGNQLGIDRAPVTSLSLLQVLPNAGRAGTVVSVFGAGFSATPADDVVRFGSVAATVTAATTTKLTVTVPAGVATGTVTVTVAGVTATSDSSFSVLPAGPAIGSVTPLKARSGDVLTIAGSGFDTDRTRDVVWIGTAAAVVTAATATQLKVVVPPGLPQGQVSVTTAYGSVSSVNRFYAIPSAVDLATVCTAKATLGSTFIPACANGFTGFDGSQNHNYTVSFPAACVGGETAGSRAANSVPRRLCLGCRLRPSRATAW